MSRQSNKSLFNKSLGSGTFKSRYETTVPTVFVALNKLKFEQDKLLEEQKRFRVLNRQISKQQIIMLNKQNKNQYFSSVKKSADMEIQMKRQHQRKQMEELKHRFSTNTKAREQNKKMIQNVRKSFRDANHQLYEQIRKKKQENQNHVKTERKNHMNSRIINRSHANQLKDLRRKSIQNFYESRSKSNKQSKQQQIAQLIKKSQQKRKIYGEISSRNSRIRQIKLNSSRLSTNKSLKNPEIETVTQ